MPDNLNNSLLEKISNKKALIWDFDGVLCYLNWEYGSNVDEWWELFGDLYRQFEKEIEFKTFEESAYPDENIDVLLTKYGKPAEIKINEFFLEKESLILPHSQANKEVLEIIRNIDTGIENFLWSNNQKVTIEKFLGDNNLASKFKAIISRGREGYMSKPDTKAFEIIREVTDIPVTDFMFIGDSVKTDKIVASRLGMDFFHYS